QLDLATEALVGLDHPNRVYALAVPSPEEFLAVGYTLYQGKTVVRGRPSTGQREVQFGTFEGVLRFAALSATGRRLLLGLDDRNSVGVWEVRPFRHLSVATFPGDITAWAIAPAGDALAVAHGPEVTCWNVGPGE